MIEKKHRRLIYDDPCHGFFITFACDRRRKLLNQSRCKRIVVSYLEHNRLAYDCQCLGFVIMPEHVHALVMFSQAGMLSKFKQEWKRQSSVAISNYFAATNNPICEFLNREDGSRRVWTPKSYDFNVYSNQKAREKIEYMHENPVRRGLVRQAIDYPYSSARWYADGRSVAVTMTHLES